MNNYYNKFMNYNLILNNINLYYLNMKNIFIIKYIKYFQIK